jgi:hypothetical protein
VGACQHCRVTFSSAIRTIWCRWTARRRSAAFEALTPEEQLAEIFALAERAERDQPDLWSGEMHREVARRVARGTPPEVARRVNALFAAPIRRCPSSSLRMPARHPGCHAAARRGRASRPAGGARRRRVATARDDGSSSLADSDGAPPERADVGRPLARGTAA